MAEKIVEKADGFFEVRCSKTLNMPTGVHQAFPGTEFASVLRLRPLDFRCDDTRRDCARNLICHFVLDGENVFECPIVTLGPDVMPVGSIDQLRADADAVPR